MTRESTTVVNQLTSSYKYMLGASSLVFGVQSYSDNPKKSSNFDMMDAVTRPRVRDKVAAKEDAAVTRMDPPRCEDLFRCTRKSFICRKDIRSESTYRICVSDLSSSVHATSKCSRLVTIWEIWERFEVVCALRAIFSLIYLTRMVSKDCINLHEPTYRTVIVNGTQSPC